MRKILILAVLLMLLAAPVLADKKYQPNYQSEGSTAYWAYADGYEYCGWVEGYGEIGLCVSDRGGHQNLGISYYAHWRQ